MLKINFLACTKVELYDLVVCIVVNGEKFQKSHRDLDLDRTRPIIELIRDIFIIILKYIRISCSLIYFFLSRERERETLTSTL